MAIVIRRTHKHFRLDSAKIKRAQKALHARTETEAIERALDFAIAEHEKTAWFFKPRSVLSRMVLKLRTSTARWLVRCGPHSSALPSICPRCVGETMRLLSSGGWLPTHHYD
jgi:hypothetical protein